MAISLSLNRFRFLLQTVEPLSLPEFLGSTLRGGFGHALKRRVCLFEHGRCGRCLLRFTCAYSYVFETPLPLGDTPAGHGGSHAPHPFVLCPSLEGTGELDVGDEFAFHFVLVGRAMEYLPYFIMAVEEMGCQGLGRGRGRFRLIEVAEVISGMDLPIYRDTPLDGLFDLRPLIWSTEESIRSEPGEVVIRFLTSFRLHAEGRPVEQLNFQVFFTALLRRIKLLAHYHCGGADWDYRPLLTLANGVQTVATDFRPQGWLRWSERQYRKTRLEGLTGYLHVVGDLMPLLPFLDIGQVIHVGKATVFGFGRYKMMAGPMEREPCHDDTKAPLSTVG